MGRFLIGHQVELLLVLWGIRVWFRGMMILICVYLTAMNRIWLTWSQNLRSRTWNWSSIRLLGIGYFIKLILVRWWEDYLMNIILSIGILFATYLSCKYRKISAELKKRVLKDYGQRNGITWTKYKKPLLRPSALFNWTVLLMLKLT